MKKSLFRILALLLAVVTVLGCFAGCAKKSDAETADTDEAETTQSAPAETPKKSAPAIDWRKDTTGKYLRSDAVKSLLCVMADGESGATVKLFEKYVENGRNVWTLSLTCDAVIGQNGLGKTKEGDGKTPQGDYGITQAFGIRSNPGTHLPYTDVTDDIYCCEDPDAYNQIINIKDHEHNCSGEHMIDYSPEYNYGFQLDYNKENKEGAGSAIFFHCKGAKNDTAGCIAVDEANMITILQRIDANTRVIIDYAP